MNANKRLVWDYWRMMHQGGDPSAAERFLSNDCDWHGFRPLRRMVGGREIWLRFWRPLLQAMPDLVRRPYIFLGGRFEEQEWVCGTGDLIGTFAADWRLGDCLIPASAASVHFRFGEFCRVVDQRIVEIRILVDLIDLLRQVGVDLLPGDYGRSLWVPGPLQGGGILHAAQDEDESAETLALVEAMIFGGLNEYDGKDQASQGLERFWHANMVWHGPAAIGTANGLDEFKQNAQGPIVAAFPDRKGVGHVARIAEGRFAASTGWPSLAGTHTAPFKTWQPTNAPIGWNIMDFWKRKDEKLWENWVMIDLIDAAHASRVDLLNTIREQPHG